MLIIEALSKRLIIQQLLLIHKYKELELLLGWYAQEFPLSLFFFKYYLQINHCQSKSIELQIWCFASYRKWSKK